MGAGGLPEYPERGRSCYAYRLLRGGGVALVLLLQDGFQLGDGAIKRDADVAVRAMALRVPNEQRDLLLC